jgi:hypothetical protein
MNQCTNLCDLYGLSIRYYKKNGLAFCSICRKAFPPENIRCPCCNKPMRTPYGNHRGGHK